MADSRNCESGQYGGNELPCQRSALSESSSLQKCFEKMSPYSSEIMYSECLLCEQCIIMSECESLQFTSVMSKEKSL